MSASSQPATPPAQDVLAGVPRLETHPSCPAISQQWYEARPLFAAIGKTWANANQNMSTVPDEHKAQLMRLDAQGRSQNVWCVSPAWAEIVIQKLNGIFPTPPERVKGFKPEVENIAFNTDLTIPTSYAEALTHAEAIATPCSLMLLLDRFRLRQVQQFEAMIAGKTCKNPVLTRALDVYRRMADDEQAEMRNYIEWLKEDLSND